MAALLDSDTVIDHLRDRGLISSTDAAKWGVEELSGGVSSVVFAARRRGRALVVKQSLERLRVADEWLAPTQRILSEAAMLRAMRSSTPEHVPAVYDVDVERRIICIEHAPPTWTDWKTQIFAGQVNRSVAERLGTLLATWHSTTSTEDEIPPILRDQSATFESLRVDPYYRATAERLPKLRERILNTSNEMLMRRECLVHGDFSPKNTLVAREVGSNAGFWVIDCEVAHRGDPSFDVAFLVTHLLLKSVHFPQLSVSLHAAADTFIEHYQTAVAHGIRFEPEHLNRQIGCLLLARVYGKSPATYLTSTERTTVTALGTAMLTGQRAIA